MSLQCVAILSPGDMGHSVGRVLVDHGLRVITCLQGRGERTRRLAAEANIADVPSYEELVREADLALSILVPAQATNAAERVAAAVAQTGADLAYADCNAISPGTVRRIGQIMSRADVRFIDASIIGGPPRGRGRNVIYAAGSHVQVLLELNAYGLHIIDLQGEIGHASGLKMCYAALTKGLTALCTELLTAAEALGISEKLAAEFGQSQGALYQRMERGIPGMPTKARRWIGEMEEIAKTFGDVGLTPAMLSGAADMYRLVAGTRLADRTPEDAGPPPTLAETVATLAEHL